MYKKLNDSPETEKEKKIPYLNKRKKRPMKEQLDKLTKIKKTYCNRGGAPYWSRQHEYPARGKKCAKCGEIGHFAKICRANRMVNHVLEGKTSSADEDDFTLNTIYSVKQKTHSTRLMNNSRPEFSPPPPWPNPDQSDPL